MFLFSAFFSQQAHTDTLTDLHFTLAFAHCVMELASSKEPRLGAVSSEDVSFLEQSLVTDQISQLSKEWRWACLHIFEPLVKVKRMCVFVQLRAEHQNTHVT